MVLVVALLGGCSSTQPDAAPSAPATNSAADPAASDGDGSALTAFPFDSISAALDDFIMRVGTAQGLAAQSCAEGIGIDSYRPLQLEPATPLNGYGRFGLEDADVAARDGYVVNAGDDQEVSDPAADLPATEAAALQNALTGPNPEELVLRDADGVEMGRLLIGDGCYRRFYESFFGGLDNYVHYLELRQRIEQARIDADAALSADVDYLSLVSAWESCMSTAGFPVEVGPAGPALMSDGPDGLPSGPDVDQGFVGWPEPRPSDDERQTAQADVTCKQSTDFVPSATELAVKHETEIADAIGLAELDAELRQIFLNSGTG